MPPRASSADSVPTVTGSSAIAAAVRKFLDAHPEAVVLEAGRPLFELRSAKYEIRDEHNRCTLHFWNDERNLVRTIVSATPKSKALRLSTIRPGQPQTKLLELTSSVARRERTSRETQRTRYVALLERVLARHFPEEKPHGFRTAMDLERSFGPSYARGSLVRGNRAWAIIGINAAESTALIDGILTLGILWLDHCRRHGDGRRIYPGLRVIVPRGTSMLTLSRMAWLHPNAASWELYELDEASEELMLQDPADTGNIRTRLVHRPDEAAARERFAEATAQVMTLVPPGEEERVEQQLRSTSELAFLLHGLEFARARIGLSPQSFAHTFDITVGVGVAETALTPDSVDTLREHVRELFDRRRAIAPDVDFSVRRQTSARRIGSQQQAAAHARTPPTLRRRTTKHTAQDPLFRAAPERWLESMLRHDLAPLTRGLGPNPNTPATKHRVPDANDDDNIGNRVSPPPEAFFTRPPHEARAIARFDPRFIYSQVPAIAGASDRGMLDLLGLTADGRLAVIELKANEDLHFALQGLDYWLRVRQHHLAAADAATGLGEFQRHGYFVGAQLSPLAPRLYLVAPALRIHPATEIMLRYFSPQVEWQLLALDERWRECIRVVWRKSSGSTGKEQRTIPPLGSSNSAGARHGK